MAARRLRRYTETGRLMESCAQAHLQINLRVSVPSLILRASAAGKSWEWVSEGVGEISHAEAQRGRERGGDLELGLCPRPREPENHR